jgi:hypothetical protein
MAENDVRLTTMRPRLTVVAEFVACTERCAFKAHYSGPLPQLVPVLKTKRND